MEPTELEVKVASAAVLGTVAFKNGQKRIPALDKDLRPLFAGLKVGEGAVQILDAWLGAWDDANLCAPVEE